MASSPPDSREEIQVVRKSLRARGRSSRTLDERLAVRFPRLVAALSRLIGRLPPSSRVRQAVLVRGLGLAAAAYNRGDLEAVVSAWRPDFEYRPASNLVDAGLIEPCYRGLPGYRAYVAAAAEVWGDETRFEPHEYIDLGDRLVVLAEAPLRAQASGVPLTLEFAYVTTLAGGMVVRQQEFHDHGEALEAVGLRR
jgi:ketosteroid isomerase-like protein